MHRKSQFYIIPILICVSMSAFITLSAQENRELQAQLLELLPKQGELKDWQIVSQPRFFGPDNLYDYIDGAADLYLLYGFRKVITVEYILVPDSSSVNVEIYCMNSPLHAFGMYAAERSPDVRSVAIGVQGYIVANVLVFYKGPYYVKITTFVSSKDLSAPLTEMGRSIDDKILGKFKDPEMFRYFPKENKVKQSERFIPTDFLGQSYLQNGYRCDYVSGQETYQIFIVPLESDTTAETVLKKYKLFLESQNFNILHQGDNKVVIAEKENFNLAFIVRSYFCGVLSIKNMRQGQTVVETMRKNFLNQ